MDLIVHRREFRKDGIFGFLMDHFGGVIAQTLEHAYPDGKHGWAPKVPPGVYHCKRGMHRIHAGPILTFEVMGVPGHHGILFHPGNTNKDSEGCFLLGDKEIGAMITNSRATFEKFMAMQAGVDEFRLTVRS